MGLPIGSRRSLARPRAGSGRPCRLAAGGPSLTGLDPAAAHPVRRPAPLVAVVCPVGVRSPRDPTLGVPSLALRWIVPPPGPEPTPFGPGLLPISPPEEQVRPRAAALAGRSVRLLDGRIELDMPGVIAAGVLVPVGETTDRSSRPPCRPPHRGATTSEGRHDPHRATGQSASVRASGPRRAARRSRSSAAAPSRDTSTSRLGNRARRRARPARRAPPSPCRGTSTHPIPA